MRVKRSYRFVLGGSGPDPFSPATWFGRRHPLARVARERCTAQGHHLPRRGACGACWEQVLRDDERFVVECDLPRELPSGPVDVDEVAVDRACAGEPVALSRFEVWAAVSRLRDAGLSTGQIAARLGREHTVVRRILAGLAACEVAA